MKTIIYADYNTNLGQYENIISDEIIVYDKDGSIETKLPKETSTEIFKNVDNIIFTQNCIINGEYNIKSLEEACTQIRDIISNDTVLIFDTKVPPRTVYKMSKVIDEYGLIPDINIAYTTEIKHDTRVISGTNENSINRTISLYENMTQNIKTTKHIQTAEAITILQNAYKDTLIALSNQAAILSEALTIDLIEAIDLANLEEDVHLKYPQPIQENKISRDTNELINLANEYGEASQIFETIRSTNNYVAYHMAYMAEKELFLKEHLAMFETTVAILGITNDETLKTEKDNASLILIDDFVQRDVEVWVHDDKIPETIIENHGAKKITLEEAYDADCIIIMTDTPEYRKINPEKVQKVIITAQPLLSADEFKDKEFSSVGQYRLKKGEML
ncbi:UDP binding domain-containing protein [Methanosphaera sp.]